VRAEARGESGMAVLGDFIFKLLEPVALGKKTMDDDNGCLARLGLRRRCRATADQEEER